MRAVRPLSLTEPHRRLRFKVYGLWFGLSALVLRHGARVQNAGLGLGRRPCSSLEVCENSTQLIRHDTHADSGDGFKFVVF